MRGTYLLTIGALLISSLVHSQNGSISNAELSIIRKAYDKNDASTRAITNALTNTDIKNLVVNRENVGKTDHYFKYRIKTGNITDQKSSGRCWMFTSLNTFRNKVAEKLNMSTFEFSENYLYFWDIFEKSNLFLENVIATAQKPWDDRYVEWFFKAPVDDGGMWSSYINLVEKYGVVPKNVMPETNSSSNTSQLQRIINQKIREQGYILREMLADKKVKSEDIQKEKIKMMGSIYRILCLNLGEPPTEFAWRFRDKNDKISDTKTYTPISFLKEVLPNIVYGDYVMIMNNPSRPYYQYFEVENYRNTKEGVNWKYINLPNDVIKQLCMASIKANEPLYASCDVGQQLDGKEGLLSLDNYDYESIYGMKFGMDKKARILTRESGSSHGMALIAFDTDKNEQPIKWQFENSWGSNSGQNGYLTFTDEWFNEYMFRFVIQKKFLTPEILKVLDQKPTMCPPWDPMF
ncbi:MAG TPA: biotin transporter BioY [Bacteroidales bacterium]|nr:biotin transporter BioY [Bacteroidales bacterium]